MAGYRALWVKLDEIETVSGSFADALVDRDAGVVLIHNYPHGDLEPSPKTSPSPADWCRPEKYWTSRPWTSNHRPQRMPLLHTTGPTVREAVRTGTARDVYPVCEGSCVPAPFRTRATARAAIPSFRPRAPIRSGVVPLTETFSRGIPRTSATRSRIKGT